ncbi:uncharacterized protein A1O9_12062 [Exophiala aquamarina CBS 119918]|uniref:Uncharacterized protein n=1 Tax=Exophiala aquamarina CBS 119918 TaxID=1182545 RepID=A0A072NXB8_9EURO|nr:uncharacterized protein A1O9_12062 [Exophiala aquamarina CBS 119918]KEF52072.1 hypothetical protein A1O9_12062 [Exophiala aquamarina CBS 119918]
MHQTAKEFMSRYYLWDKIFYSCAGFVRQSDLDLAMLSGLVRRLKCCREAAIIPDVPEDLDIFDDHPGLNDGIPYWPETPPRGCELLDAAITYAMSSTPPRDCFDHFVELVDELDNAGIQLTRDWKNELPETYRSSQIANVSWIEFFLIPDEESHPLSASLKFRSFLDLAILFDFEVYVEAKIKRKEITPSQLQSLLLRATRFMLVQWQGIDRTRQEYPKPGISRMLLRKGADPNCRDAESNAAIASEHGWTAWTGLLQDDYYEGDPGTEDYFLEQWILTVKVFLNYGADPTVQWHRPHIDKKSDEHRRVLELASPDIIFIEALADKPKYKKDLADIMDLLSRAKANWGDGTVQREQVEGY